MALGTFLFAAAESYEAAFAGRAIIGLGSASMGAATYVIVARAFPPKDFGYVNGLVVGLGGIGGLIGTYPLAFALERAPWGVIFSAAGVAALGLAFVVWTALSGRRYQPHADEGGSGNGGYLTLLRDPEFLRILALGAVTFGPIVTVTGVWGGPYFRDIHGLTPDGMGAILLLLFAATILGGFAFAWMERRGFRRRRVIFGAVIVSVASLAILALVPFAGPAAPTALLFAMVFFQQFYIPLGAHMRRVAPSAMMARASTLLLFTSIAAIPAMQTGFGVILDLARAAGVSEEAGYRIGFGALAGLIAVAALIYAGARDVDET